MFEGGLEGVLLLLNGIFCQYHIFLAITVKSLKRFNDFGGSFDIQGDLQKMTLGTTNSGTKARFFGLQFTFT